MSELSTMFNAVCTALETAAPGPALAKSAHLLNPQVTPSTGVARTYSLDLQSRNTGKMRDRTAMRLSHALKVTVVILARPNDVAASQVEALDLEEKVLDVLLTQSRVAAYRVAYVRTQRTLNPSGELLFVDVYFDLEQSLSVTA